MPLQVGELYAAIDVDQEKFNKGLKSAENSFKGLASKLDGTSAKMKKIGTGMTMGVTMPILGAAAASFKLAADMQDAMGATEQIFKTSADSMKDWAKDLDVFYGISSQQALEYSNTMGAMLQNIGGLSEDEAARQAQVLTELAGDLTAMFGGTTESAVQALTGALKGNNSMLDNYGMGVNETTIKMKAMEMGLLDGGKSMDLATKQAATLALIMEQTQDAQGQAAREADGASGSMRSFSTAMKNLGETIGTNLLPVFTPVIDKIAGMVERFGKMSPASQKMVLAVAGIAAAIGPLLIILGSMANGLGAIILVAPKLFAALRVVSLFMTGPLGLAFAGLVTAGLLIWKNWDKLKTTLPAIWRGIKDGVMIAFKPIIAGIQKIIDLWNKVRGMDVGNLPKKPTVYGTTGTGGTASFRQKDAASAKPASQYYKYTPLKGFASGTDYAPGGLSWVGERGPELVNLPRGSQVLSNSKSMAAMGNQTVHHTGTVRVEGVNNRQELVAVVEKVFNQSFAQGNRRIPQRVAMLPSRA